MTLSATRILHVVGAMNPGGVETWLMQLLRHINRDRYRMDFLVHTSEPGVYDEEIHALGSKIIPCLHHRRPLVYGHNFMSILRSHGPYDLVHSHVHLFSGYVLQLARRMGVPIRISHSHNDTSRQRWGPVDRLYRVMMRRWLRHHSTERLACSRQAATALYGEVPGSESPWKVISYGRDLSAFRLPVDKLSVRAELGIPAQAFVVGHVGSFTEQKNHLLWIKVAGEIARRDPNARFLLVGDGRLRPIIEQRAEQLKLSDKVVFARTRTDVPRLMLGATDLFFFPSLWEGLGLALVEAQAAGLPCVVADVVPPEADVVAPLLRRLPLTSPVSAWADAILHARDARPRMRASEALASVENSSFNIENSLQQMEAVYRA